MLGDPLGRAGISPRAMGTSTVCTLGRPVQAQAASSHSAPLNRAPVLPRGVLLRADGALGPLGLVAVGGGMAPLPATQAKRIWPRLLGSVDPVPAPGGLDPAPAKAAEGCLAQDCSHHRQTATPLPLEPGPGLSPAQPSDVRQDVNPGIPRFDLLPEFPQASPVPHAMLQGQSRDQYDHLT